MSRVRGGCRFNPVPPFRRSMSSQLDPCSGRSCLVKFRLSRYSLTQYAVGRRFAGKSARRCGNTGSNKFRRPRHSRFRRRDSGPAWPPAPFALTVSHFLVAPHVLASSDLALAVSEHVIGPYVKPLRLRELRLPLRVSGYRLTQVWAQRSEDDEGHSWLRRVLAKVSRDGHM